MMIVLIEPLIPQNTGSIARTCAATKTPLHLVGKLGFEITEKNVRRAGLDYWPYVELYQHQTWDEFIEKAKPDTCWFFECVGERSYTDAKFSSNDALVFGCETVGLTPEFLKPFPKEQILKIPFECPHVRSLNLSNCVSIGLYEARRQVAVNGSQSLERGP